MSKLDLDSSIQELNYELKIIEQGRRFIESEFGQRLIDKFVEKRDSLVLELLDTNASDIGNIARLQAEIKISNDFTYFYNNILGDEEVILSEIERKIIIG